MAPTDSAAASFTAPRHLVESLYRDVLARHGRLELPASGDCMWPSLAMPTQLRVVPTTWDELAVGDVVVFRRRRAYFAHRLLVKFCEPQSGMRMILTKGDLNDAVDPTVGEAGLLGRVSHYHDGQRWVGLEAGWRSWALLFVVLSPFSPLITRLARRLRKLRSFF